jgi:hypothetical protein
MVSARYDRQSGVQAGESRRLRRERPNRTIHLPVIIGHRGRGALHRECLPALVPSREGLGAVGIVVDTLSTHAPGLAAMGGHDRRHVSRNRHPQGLAA